jgi:hypothetical protein
LSFVLPRGTPLRDVVLAQYHKILRGTQTWSDQGLIGKFDAFIEEAWGCGLAHKNQNSRVDRFVLSGGMACGRLIADLAEDLEVKSRARPALGETRPFHVNLGGDGQTKIETVSDSVMSVVGGMAATWTRAMQGSETWAGGFVFVTDEWARGMEQAAKKSGGFGGEAE